MTSAPSSRAAPRRDPRTAAPAARRGEVASPPRARRERDAATIDDREARHGAPGARNAAQVAGGRRHAPDGTRIADDARNGHDGTRTADDMAAPAFLAALGERLRTLRARRGLTRKALAAAADVSERHLANLESGVGNASILVLVALARALDCPLTAIVADAAHDSPERFLIDDLLSRRSDDELVAARQALAALLADDAAPSPRRRIALIGLRGAGKSTLGARLARALGVRFVELSRDIERLAGCGASEIHALYGQAAYRRYERRALEAVLAADVDAVIATPGGIVSEPATFNRLLSHCTTVWVKATPEEHMRRVIAQGDRRPMAGNREAMADLKRILDGRAAFYAKADLRLDTAGLALDEASRALAALVAGRRAQRAAGGSSGEGPSRAAQRAAGGP
jgi:XRE family aerobic/anaerobic benzoate catabolism transcriptional regulator